MKKELGIDSKAQTVASAVESLPEVQDALQEFVAADDKSDSPAPPAKPLTGGRSLGVSQIKIDERNRRIVELTQMGLTPQTVLKHINSQAGAMGWGTITTIGTINRIVADFYINQTPPVRELRAHEQGLKEAMFNAIQRTIEKANLYIAKREAKNDWKPFEFMAAIETLARLQENLVNFKNWNASKMNPLIAVQQNNTYISVFDKNAEDVIENRKLLQPVIDLLDECLEEAATAKAT